MVNVVGKIAIGYKIDEQKGLSYTAALYFCEAFDSD